MEEPLLLADILREACAVIDFFAHGGIIDISKINKQGQLRLILSPLTGQREVGSCNLAPLQIQVRVDLLQAHRARGEGRVRGDDLEVVIARAKDSGLKFLLALGVLTC